MTSKQSLLHCLIYSQVYMVLLEPISYRFMSPVCLSTKERGFFPPYSFPSFPRETKPWIFQPLTSCKVISTNSLLQCFIVGKRQKLQNLITNDASAKKSWLLFCIYHFSTTQKWFSLVCFLKLQLLVLHLHVKLSRWKLPNTLNIVNLKNTLSVTCMYSSERKTQDMVWNDGLWWFYFVCVCERRGLAVNFGHQVPAVGTGMNRPRPLKSHHVPRRKAADFVITSGAQVCSLRWQFSNLHH